jgi:hypothetical protein
MLVRMTRTSLLVVGATLLLCGCKGRGLDGRSWAAAPRRAAYDVTPLLAAVRPEVRSALTQQLQLADLTDLPYYDIDLALDAAAGALAGRYVLHYLNRTGREARALPLLLHPNTVRELGGPRSSALIKLTAAKALDGPAVTIHEQRLTVVELRFARPLRIGERVKLEVQFTGSVRRLPSGSNDVFGQALSSLGVSGGGAGASDYGLLAAGDGIITLASAYPMVAPFRRGHFDVDRPTRFGDLAYNDLCHFRLRVAVPPGYAVATNLLELPGQQRTASGATVYTAVGAANRDLVLIAGRSLEKRSQQLGPIRVVSTFASGDKAGGQLALRTAVESLRLFQERFGPYPYTELDVAEATLVGGAGGVEFPGMVLIAGMLYRPPSRSTNPMAQLMRLMGNLGNLLQRATDAQTGKTPKGAQQPLGLRSMDALIKELAVFTVAHEVAHQYFAGLVGSDCRVDPALDEPLAQFAAGEYVKQLRGAAAGARMLDANARLNYGIYRLLGGADRAANQPVRAFPSALSYAAIVYGKAPYFYIALRKRLGAARFDRALRQAVFESRFKIVTLAEWLRSLERAAGGRASGVAPLARRWFEERHGDQDLGLDADGDMVLAEIMGKETVQQLREGMAVLGMKPRDLFRMIMGNMLGDERKRGDDSLGGGLLDALREMQKLGK